MPTQTCLGIEAVSVPGGGPGIEAAPRAEEARAAALAVGEQVDHI